MSDYDVYEDEMLTKRFSETEVERLLTGRAPDDPGLALLGAALIELHRESAPNPEPAEVERFAAEAAAIARSTRPGPQPVTSASPSRRPLALLQGRLAVVASAMVVLLGMTGVAAASDDAAPGDPLYGVDRALERIGINDGAAEERLEEAQALIARGEVSKAMDHAAAAIEEPGPDATSQGPVEPASPAAEAATALREAAVEVEEGEGDQASQDVRDAVSTMLSEMAALMGDPDLDGEEFGRRVSEMARSIAAERAGDADTETGPPVGTPGRGGESPGRQGPKAGSSDDDRGGRPDDVPGGPPDDAGPPGGGSSGNGGGPPPGAGRP